MSKRKICIVITSRGNYAKMKSVIASILERDDLELQIIVAGGAVLDRYGNIARTMEANWGPEIIDRRIHYLVEGEDAVAMAKSAAMATNEFATAFENMRPDVVIVIADRYECLPIAMVASYMNIPVAHVEGGEVSGSIDESIRHAITKLAHLHFPATRDAAARIRRMGEEEHTIKVVGATSLDVIAALDLSDLSDVVQAQKDGKGVGPVLDLDQPYLVVIQHPVTTEYNANFQHVNETIEAVHDIAMPVIWLWPNMDAGADGVSKALRVWRENKRPAFLHMFKALPIELYAPLLHNAACLIGNSSSGIRESAFMGTPTVNVGTRQGGRERGHNVIDVDYDRRQIQDAVRRQIAHGRYAPDHLYGDGQSGKRIVEELAVFDFTLQKRIIY